MNKQFTCHIQFRDKDSHEKKTFKDKYCAMEFIERNKDKIRCVNAQGIFVLDLFDLKGEPHFVSREELFYILDADPFE